MSVRCGDQGFGLISKDQQLTNISITNSLAACSGRFAAVDSNLVRADTIDAPSPPEPIVVSDFSDGNFSIYTTSDPSANMQFDTQPISSGTTRVFVAPNANGVLPATPGIAGSNNFFLGPTSFSTITSLAQNNVGIGGTALIALTDGTDNVALGNGALTSLTDGQYNTAIGGNALRNAAQVVFNTAVGYGALENNLNSRNVAVGTFALGSNTSGNQNTAVGHQSLGAVTTATDNVGLGTIAGSGITTGVGNVAVGSFAMSFGPSTGFGNVALGLNAGQRISSGSSNTCIGRQSGTLITSGGSNCLLGDSAGLSLTTGFSNLLLGIGSNVDNGTRSGCIVLGTGGAVTSADNQLVIHGSGANMRGRVTLMAGAATVMVPSVTANSIILLTNQLPSGTVGSLAVSARSAGTSFTIQSYDGAGALNAADTSNVGYLIFEP